MKLRPTQFGVRENTASTRQHASRLAVGPLEQEQPIGLGNAQAEVQPPSDPRIVETLHLSVSDRVNEATEVKTGESNRLLTVEEVASLLHVPVSWVYGRTRKRSSERLPGYRLGKYWRFREDEVLGWVESQQGSSMQLDVRGKLGCDIGKGRRAR
jgi:excisionase family DNA binding protein